MSACRVHKERGYSFCERCQWFVDLPHSADECADNLRKDWEASMRENDRLKKAVKVLVGGLVKEFPGVCPYEGEE